jgi:plasmid stabilization system protein ParE
VVNVSFLPAADADYQDARAWYATRSRQAAAGFEAAVAVAVKEIADNPELYNLLDDRHRRCMLRRFPYSLIYRVEALGILVVAVAHSRRSSSYWHGRN